MTTTYRDAAEKLWGEAGAYVHDVYREHLHLFENLPDELPIVIGITAYGRCLGLSRMGDDSLGGERISIASNLFGKGTVAVSDTVLHEMMHVSLYRAGRGHEHKSADWYAECERLAPFALGHGLELVPLARQRKSVRVDNPDWSPGLDVPKSVVRKVPVEGIEHGHDKVSRFPGAFRAGEGGGRIIPVPMY